MRRKPISQPSSTPYLTGRINQLNSKRQEIIRPILENPREFVLLSVRSMAKRLHTDPATVVRIVRGLGFPSYRDFQRHLHDLSITFATSLDTMQHTGRDTSMPGYVRDSLEQDLKNLQGLKNSLDAQRLVSIVKRIHKARRILILTGDLATVLSEYVNYQLSVLGLPIFAANSPGRVLHLVRTLRKGDLVIAISFRRGLRQTVEGAREAREKGAYCVGIADTYLSPLARECDELFLAGIDSTSYGASYTAPVALINALIAACGQYRHSHTLAVIKEASEEQRRGFRWYAAQDA
jgi:RpiR family transcriptional regulator, carbohydrate utilization regulator